jgi:hypothetical protein
MDQAGLLKSLAETGYNVGFGAKKHFATFDIVEKGPGWIGFISAACGVYALVFEQLSAKVPSATLVVAGIVALYISFYRSAEYEKAGKELTLVYNELRDTYRAVQAGGDLVASQAAMKQLEQRFYAASISKQILFSDWYAHFKFFGQHQIAWIDEQLHFGFWKDKLPASGKLLIIVLGACALWVVFGALGWVPGPGALTAAWRCP